MSEKKLLLCPFCGGEAIYEIDEKDEIVDKIPALFCNLCKVIFKVENDSPHLDDDRTYEYLKEKTIKVWNTRKPMERIVERLEELQEEYMYPDDDDYTCGQYDAFRESIKIIKEEGGLNER